MSTHSSHPYHLVDYSSWTLTGAMIMVSGVVKWLRQFYPNLLFTGIMIVILTMIQWLGDVSLEETFHGLHMYPATMGLQWEMNMFSFFI